MANLFGLVLTLDGTVQNIATAMASVLPAGNTNVNSIQMKAAAANTATTFVGGSTVTDASDAWDIIPVGGTVIYSGGNRTFVQLTSLYVKGTNGHKLHIIAS